MSSPAVPPAPSPPTSDPSAAPRTRRQWVTLGLGAVLLAALCVLAAFWQWHRYTDREAQIDLVESNYSARPVDLAELVAGPGATLAADDEWRPARATGSYRPQDTTLLRNRPVGGRAGFHVLVPFVTELGGERVVLVVDRGYVPLGDDASSPASVPAPPRGDVTVTVTMRPDEPASDRGAPAGQVQAINTDQVLAAGDEGAGWAQGATVGAYGQLRTENPAPPASAGTLGALPEPDTDPGSHLSYTVQWCIFALGALGGYLMLWRRETAGTRITAGDLLADDDPGTHARTERRRARRRVDEDYEDALLDAAARRRAEGPPADETQARDTSSA